MKSFFVNEVSNFILLGNLSVDHFSKNELKIARKYQGDIIYSIDDISLTNVDTLSNKCPQFDNVIAELYAETHKHTSFVYMDTEQKVPKVREITKNGSIPPGSVAKSTRNADTLVIHDFVFKTGSSQINIQYHKILDSLVKFIQNKKISRIDINGYTDDIFEVHLQTDKRTHYAIILTGGQPKIRTFLYRGRHNIRLYLQYSIWPL